MNIGTIWMRRLPAIALLNLCIGSAVAEESLPDEPEPEATIAAQARESLSFDPFTLAALEVDSVDAYNIALDSIADALLRNGTLAPLVQRCCVARAACADAWDSPDYNAVLLELTDAIQNLKHNAGDWSDDFDEAFDQEDAEALSNAALNIVLESPMRLLPLDAQQREALWEAQALRNHDVFHPETRHRAAYLALAQEDYWRKVEQILSSEQYALLTIYYERIAANLPDLLEAENQAFDESRHAALPHWKPFFASVHPHVGSRILRAIGWVQTISLPRAFGWKEMLGLPAADPAAPAENTALEMADTRTHVR